MRTMWGDQRGLTLVEMLIALVLMSLVVATFYQLLSVGVRGWGALEGQLDVQQHPRIALERVAAETRQARDVVVGDAGTSFGLVKVTVLTADAPAGFTTISVEDPGVLAVGRPVVLLSLDRLEQGTVQSIAGTTVTLTAALARTHRRGEAVRRGLSTLSAPASTGTNILTVASGGTFQVGDIIAVGEEGALNVILVVGNVLTVTPALSQSHGGGELVQPLSAVFQCEGGCPSAGSTLIRCAQNCTVAANRLPLADALTAPTGRTMFAVVSSTLTSGAAPGDTQVCVASAAGFASGDRVQVGREAHGTTQASLPDRRVVTSIIGNCLTLDRGLARSYPLGTAVRVNAVDFNATATRFNSTIGQTQEVSVTTKVRLRN